VVLSSSARKKEFGQAFHEAQIVSEAVATTRSWVNTPPGDFTPPAFAAAVEAAVKDVSKGRGPKVSVRVRDEKELLELGCGGILGVGMGSSAPPRLVELSYSPRQAVAHLALVGKGVTFDSGGLTIKPPSGMNEMKSDMAGAAAVVQATLAIARLGLPLKVTTFAPMAENMVSGSSVRPGDVLTMYGGTTVEVLNTDAEGRLVLADVLWYAQERFKPRFIVDLATLTGAIIVALGKEYAGLFSNDHKLATELDVAGEATGERVWRMPLAKAYDKLIDSKNADMKNIGGRHGGAITAAQFIQRFIKDTPWAHLDVAGTAFDSAKNEINQSWGSGWGVRLLDRLVADNYEKAER
jgi:leucyl aminopeptidase